MSGDLQKDQVQSVPTLRTETPSLAKHPQDKKAGELEGTDPANF